MAIGADDIPLLASGGTVLTFIVHRLSSRAEKEDAVAKDAVAKAEAEFKEEMRRGVRGLTEQLAQLTRSHAELTTNHAVAGKDIEQVRSDLAELRGRLSAIENLQKRVRK